MLWLFYIPSVLFIIYCFIDLSWRFWKRRYSFLTPLPNIPWLGSIPYLPKTLHGAHKFHLKCVRDYNYMYLMWIGATPVVKLARVEYVEPLLKCKETHKKSFLYDLIAEWLGRSVLIAHGPKWKKRRVALTSAFHFTILNDFTDIYEKHAKRLASVLQAYADKGEPAEVQHYIGSAMLDVMCDTSMGVTPNVLGSPDCKYAKAVDDAKKITVRRCTTIFGRNEVIFPYTSEGKKFKVCLKVLHGFTCSVINENIAKRNALKKNGSEKVEGGGDKEEKGKKRRVFIDLLFDLYDKGEIDREGIRAEVDTFMFAGHDTTSTGLGWILYELGNRPEIQRRVQEEMDEIAKEDCSLTEKIRLLKYTDCVIKECMRLRPPVPGFSRVLEKDTVFNGNVFPTGTVLNVDIYGLHMNPEYWEEPNLFNPERFAEGNSSRNPFCYIPFSAGPRNCLGQKFALRELKVFLYTILYTFNLNSIQSDDEVKTAREIVAMSSTGLHIEFKRRN